MIVNLKNYNLVKLSVLKQLKLASFSNNISNEFILKSKDVFKKLLLLKKRKSKLFRIYKRYKKRKKLTLFEQLVDLSQSKKRNRNSKLKKVFRNKSYKNIKKNFFIFKNTYHKFKNNSINIIY